MPTNPHQFGDLVPYGDPSWYRNYNRRVGCIMRRMLSSASLLLYRFPR